MVWMVELEVTKAKSLGEGFIQAFYFHKSQDANNFYNLLLLASGYREDKFIIRRPQQLDISPAELDKLSSLDAIRKDCKHFNLRLRNGLLPNPEEIWAWCPDCNRLIKEIATV